MMNRRTLLSILLYLGLFWLAVAYAAFGQSDSCIITGKLFRADGSVPAPEDAVKLSSNAVVYTYSAGAIHQMTQLGPILGTGKTVSSLLLITLFRSNVSTDPSGDVAAYQFDIHYKKNFTPGSRSEYVK